MAETNRPNIVAPEPTEVLLRLDGVKAKTGMSKAQIYRLMANGTFPMGKRIAYKMVVWKRSEIEQWIEQTFAAANNAVPTKTARATKTTKTTCDLDDLL